ncbi:IS630 transposase-related protein [Holospora undulata]|nr:IS630 transposase-related protein [Holospora undulata]
MAQKKKIDLEKLEEYIKENQDMTLKKLLKNLGIHSGTG